MVTIPAIKMVTEGWCTWLFYPHLMETLPKPEVCIVHMISSPNGIFLEGKWWFTSGLRATWLPYFTFTGHFISCRISWKWHAKWQSRTLLWAGLESLFAKNHCVYIFNLFIFEAADLLYPSRFNLEIEEIHGFPLGYKHMCIYIYIYTHTHIHACTHTRMHCIALHYTTLITLHAYIYTYTRNTTYYIYIYYTYIHTYLKTYSTT